MQALSESALAAQAAGEPDPLPANRDQVYQAAVTVMMRVVFLVFAEERGMLPTEPAVLELKCDLVACSTISSTGLAMCE